MTPTIKTIAESLSEAQREMADDLTSEEKRLVLSTRYEPRQMGGLGSLKYKIPGSVAAVGINHPVWGSHYELTPLGLAIRQYLRSGDPQ